MKLSKLLIFAAFTNAFSLAIVIPAISLAQHLSTTANKAQGLKSSGSFVYQPSKAKQDIDAILTTSQDW